ncbi:hypothetical protein KL86DYS2_11393 [uncultured Dysgonomonas sp.]|uniref:Uncharacterized protein n=1 Tax=uncultured Dysgonomonas sp. TaxID=206096 RepID=A0A212JFD4_9BACT|nr:hypothetical protein KL86DYS2_11393 [uncultured Dysgonomonas sp.]
MHLFNKKSIFNRFYLTKEHKKKQIKDPEINNSACFISYLYPQDQSLYKKKKSRLVRDRDFFSL